MMIHTIYLGSMPCGFRHEYFFMFSLYKTYVKYVTPGWAHFGPHGHDLNKLGRGPLDNATWFQTRRFLKFSFRKSNFSLCDLDRQLTRTI